MEWLAIILFLLLCSFAYAAWSAAPWVPTKKHDVERVKALLDLKPGEVIYELGCGDARMCAALAREGVRAVGLELSVLQWFAAKLRTWKNKDVEIRLANLYRHDLSKADAVYLFLMPEAYVKLRPKFERELKKRARVVSYVWPISGWEATRIDRKEGAPTLYLYYR
jgi:SAM-dependent methyltransferase